MEEVEVGEVFTFSASSFLQDARKKMDRQKANKRDAKEKALLYMWVMKMRGVNYENLRWYFSMMFALAPL